MYKVDIHLSLDEAREELKKRWENAELRQAIERELGEKLWPEFRNCPRTMLGRCLPSPDNGFTFFNQCSHYLNAKPLAIEYLEDLFVSMNEEKKGLGRLRLTLEDGTKAIVDIMDFYANEKKRISEAVLKTGERLIDFHHNLLELSGFSVEKRDLTNWIHSMGSGKPSDFYYPYLLHFVAHGIIFENFEAYEGDEKGTEFLKEVIEPIIKVIEKKFGAKPISVHLYPNPENQTPEEDFYWWSYPPDINSYLVDYARKNNFPFKIIKTQKL